MHRVLDDFYYSLAMRELRMIKETGSMAELTYHSMLYINVISITPNCTASRLAEMLGLSKPAVTMKLQELERHGYIQRQRSEIDRRVSYIILTEKMQQALQQYDAVFTSLEQRLKEIFTPEELAAFTEMLKKATIFDWRKLKYE